MTRLTDLKPRWDASADHLSFTCPLCRKGVVIVWLRLGDAFGCRHGASSIPPDFDTLTITPSINDEGMCTASNRGCPGWHGHITNGEAK